VVNALCVLCVYFAYGVGSGFDAHRRVCLRVVSCELKVSGVSASIMHTDILSFHVDVESVKGDDEQCRGGVDA
jgi:hypothetical protein